MKNWPLNTSMDAFRQAWILEGEQFWHSVFEMHKDKMQIKNPKVAIVNLEKIFTATFKLANAKGFQAMSLRDLSRETGISMGGLYAYIGSKNDLASVIEGVLRNYIDQVIGGLAGENLDPVDRLKAIIFGEIYMMQILNPWYYFCFMELKGLDRAQQEQAMELELRFERILVDAFKAGIERGDFNCARPEIQAAMVTAQLQQWHLKHWKFRLREVGMDEYAQYIYDNLLLGLGASDKSDSAPMVKLA
ncbi:MAG: TetR/AcrR family transcriptional regulator [Pseudomonadales bacterium]|nr:TetR/AcrR family transcriptional regulator [Pseudomonadales bacterium]